MSKPTSPITNDRKTIDDFVDKLLNLKTDYKRIVRGEIKGVTLGKDRLIERIRVKTLSSRTDEFLYFKNTDQWGSTNRLLQDEFVVGDQVYALKDSESVEIPHHIKESEVTAIYNVSSGYLYFFKYED